MRPRKSKCSLALSLVSLSLLCGCAYQYAMSLDNGDQVISLTKPKRQGSYYQFTGQDGVGRVIPENRVLKVQSVTVHNPDQGSPQPGAPAPAAPSKPRHWYFLWLA